MSDVSDSPGQPVDTPGTASHDPDRPAALLEFITTGWAPRDETLPAEHPSAPYRAARRAALAAKPPVAVRLGKAAFLGATETPLAPALEAMQAQLSLLNTTQDASEGVSAFLAKRRPQWRGR